MIDQDSLAAIKAELTRGETVLWSGRPSTSVVFHVEDAFLVPFSLMWGGFAIFWEMDVTGHWGSSSSQAGPSVFMALWGIPFVLIGQYLIWGRFVYAAWKKKRTYYAVTNRRIIVVQEGWTRKTVAAYIDTLPTVLKERRSGKYGTLRFAHPEPMWGRGGRSGWDAWNGMVIGNLPIFMDIEDVDSVYGVVSELREKATVARSNLCEGF